jgi:hypothetical protein
MIQKSIIFDLDLDLKVLQAGFVNSGSAPVLSSLNTLEEVWREDKSLNLSELFEPLWVKYYDGHLQPANEIFLLIGPRAGFSDSRMPYLWLKSMEMFEQKPFYVFKLGSHLDLQTQELSLTDDLLREVRRQNNQNLAYSQEPRITKKIV